MRAFVIADASKRKAKPAGVLFWEPDAARNQGRFLLELATDCSKASLPLSLSFCADRNPRRATPDESEDWVRSRIVPKDRQNIAQVLRANGLARYDEISLLAACQGRSSDDDLLVYEVRLSRKMEAELALRNASSKWDAASRADRLIASLDRRRSGTEVHYAIVTLPKDGDAETVTASAERDADADHADAPTAAQRIGAQLREQRVKAGLTQAQLGARAGIRQTVVSRIESGAGNPTLALLEDIAAALEVELEVSLRPGRPVAKSARADKAADQAGTPSRD